MALYPKSHTQDDCAARPKVEDKEGHEEQQEDCVPLHAPPLLSKVSEEHGEHWKLALLLAYEPGVQYAATRTMTSAK